MKGQVLLRPGRHNTRVRHLTTSGAWLWPLVSLAIVAAIVSSVGRSQGQLTGSIDNVGDNVATGSFLTSASSSSASECSLGSPAYDPTSVSNAATCSGRIVASGTLPASGSATAVTTMSDEGSLAGTSTVASQGVCGPISLADSAAPGDPMLVRGDTSFSLPGPSTLAGSAGIGLSGTSGYAADVSGGAGPSTTSFSEMVWFETTTSGTLIGFTNTPSAYSPKEWDKMMWVDPSGHVVFGVYPGKVVELKTSGVYNDGQWHLAVASLNASKGMSLSVDAGTPVTNTTTTSQAYSGYWHVGWDNEKAGWTDPPGNAYFTGALADAAVVPSALTAGQITALYTAGTQTAWAADVAGDGASDSWSLGDGGTGVYTGTVPDVAPAACAFVDATITVSGSNVTCAAPAGIGACPAPTATTSLESLASKVTPFALNATPTQAIAVTYTLARDATYKTGSYPYATGLNLTTSISFIAYASTFDATLTWASEDVVL